MIELSAVPILIPGDPTFTMSWDQVIKYHYASPILKAVKFKDDGSLPVWANTTGFWVPGWIDTFYNQVIIYPDKIDAGNVTSDVVFDVLVAPCYPRTPYLNLTQIKWLDPSITVEGYQSGSVESFSVLPYEVGISAAGEGSFINDSIHWIFDNLPSDAAILPVQGSRSFVFDYKGYNTSERFEWLTDVLRSSTDEMRYSLRNHSRQKYSMSFVLMGDKQHEYMERLQTLYGFVWTVPLWHEGVYVTGDVNAGDTVLHLDTTVTTLKWSVQVVLISDTGEAVSLMIDSVTDDQVILKNPVQGNMGRCRIFPARAGVSMSGLSSDVQGMHTVVTVEWTIQDPVLTDSTPEHTVRGLEILTYRSRVSQQMGQLPFDVYDAKVAHPLRYANRKNPDRWYSVSFEAVNQKESFQTRLLIDRLRGKYQAVYLPTWRSELILVNNYTSGANYIDVIWKGYNTFKDTVDTLLIQTKNVFYPFKVVSFNEQEGFQRLILEEAVNVDIAKTDVLMFCQLIKVRPADDTVEVTHGPYCSSVADINFIEVYE